MINVGVNKSISSPSLPRSTFFDKRLQCNPLPALSRFLLYALLSSGRSIDTLLGNYHLSAIGLLSDNRTETALACILKLRGWLRRVLTGELRSQFSWSSTSIQKGNGSNTNATFWIFIDRRFFKNYILYSDFPQWTVGYNIILFSLYQYLTTYPQFTLRDKMEHRVSLAKQRAMMMGYATLTRSFVVKTAICKWTFCNNL